MANISTILADLKSGRCSSMVEVRLLRFWEARKIKRGGHLMVVGMLILDSKVNLTFKVMFVIVLNSSLVFRFIFNRIMMSILSLSSLWYGFESSFKLCDFCFKMFSGDAHARHHRCEPSSHLPVTLEGAGSKFSMSGFDITRCIRILGCQTLVWWYGSVTQPVWWDNPTVSPILKSTSGSVTAVNFLA